MSTAAGLLLCCLLPGSAQREVVLDRPVPRLLVGKKLKAELGRSISASWSNVSLRDILRRISDDRKIAILLDRRIDPTPELVVDLNDQTVLGGVQQIAERVSASVSVLGNTVYVGPRASAVKLRTLAWLRSDECFSQSATLPAGRQFDLARRRYLHWNDLDRPADLLERIARRYKLKIHGLDRVPHDLWAGTTLPDVNAHEALSLILIQFDLTFQWTDRAEGIQIVPLPQAVFIERTYTPKGTASVAASRWQDEIPGLKARADGNRVVVRGTLEQQEELEKLLRPGSGKTVTRKTSSPIPVRRRQFTLRIRRVPANELIKKLQSSGIVVKYNTKELAAVGIDLNTPISIDVNKVSADEFFKAICGPLGLKFTIEELTVTLTPK